MNWKCYSLGCLTSFILLALALCGLVVLAVSVVPKIKTDHKSELKEKSYLLVDLDRKFLSYQNSSPFDWDDEPPLALDVLQEKIAQAAQDPKIEGVIVKSAKITPLNYAKADQVSKILQNFKSSCDKKVFAYLYSCTDAKFLIASVADEIYLNPSSAAGISFLGINAKKLYLKPLLDKLGVDVRVVRTGSYKSYGEIFTQNQMSQAAQQETKKVYGAFFAQYQNQLAKNLGKKLSSIQSLFSNPQSVVLSGAEALSVIDSLAYYDNFLAANKIKNVVTLSKYELGENEISSENKVAIVYLEGSIVSQTEDFGENIDFQTTKKIFAKIEKDSSIKAVVVRINSPGGSALASHLIAQQVLKSAKVPVVVSMGSLAASGGYYIASAGDYIVAEPYTITGSIGVLAILPNATKLAQKIGVNYSGLTFGEFAGSTDIFNPQSPQLVSAIQKHIEKVYQEFCGCVAKNRKMPIAEVKKLAQGKIYTATQAKEANLIDQVGYLADAVQKAKSLAKIDTAKIVTFPKEKEWWKNILNNKIANLPFVKLIFETNRTLSTEDMVQARIWL